MRFVYDNKNVTGHRDEVKTPGKKYKSVGLLQIEVKQLKNPRRVFITTGIKLAPNQFDEKNGFTCKNHPNALAITAKAHKLYRQIEAFCLSDICQTLDDVKKWDIDESITTSVVEFIRSELKRRDPSYSVVEYNNSFIARLEEFGKIKTFSDVTYENLLGLDEHLRKRIKSQPTLYKRHILFKGYINEAIKRGLCKSNPYDLFKFSKGKSKDPIYLTEAELKQLRAYQPEIDKIQKVKDLFIFQCYTGLAYADVMNFDASYIDVVDGVRVIKSSRQKTDGSYIVPFYEEAENIALWYGYTFPRISNQKYNDYLKILAAGAGIKKNITTHTARHTFATLIINKGASLEAVSKALGHASLKQTQHYARMLGKKVVEDLKDLL